MKESRQRWIDAVVSLAADPAVKILCPENLDAELEITDVIIEGIPRRIERHMLCPKCGAYNAVVFRANEND